MEERFTLRTKTGITLAVIVSRPVDDKKTPVVIMSHGFSSGKDSSSAKALSKSLLAKNIATVRFDYFGHGESDGELGDITIDESIADLEAIINWSKEQSWAGDLMLWGSSFGGFITVLVASERDDITKIGLKAPVTNYAKLWQDRLGDEGLKKWQESDCHIFHSQTHDIDYKIKYAFYQSALPYKLEDYTSKIRAPIFIVHGDNDEAVDHKYSLKFLEFVKTDKRLEILPGADHRLTKPEDFNKTTQLFTDWFSQT